MPSRHTCPRRTRSPRSKRAASPSAPAETRRYMSTSADASVSLRQASSRSYISNRKAEAAPPLFPFQPSVPAQLFRHIRLHNKKETVIRLSLFMLALPIFPDRFQSSIVGRNELNFRVRDGNGWTLALISTNYVCHQVPLKTTCIISSGFHLVKSLVTRTGFEPMLKA